MKRNRALAVLFVLSIGVLAVASLPRAAGTGVRLNDPTPTLLRPTPRPTFPFPTGTGVPVTSAEQVLIETEPGPLYVIVSTVDEHGLKGQALVDLFGLPGLEAGETAGAIRSGTFARVLEIRRLPPDYLRGYYRVSADGLTGWVNEYLAHRTVYVIAFDEKGCACPGPVPLWADPDLSQAAGTVLNRSPLRLLALGESSVQVQVLSDGRTGWLSRDLVHESQVAEFLKYIRP
jgi:hypothetical protein